MTPSDAARWFAPGGILLLLAAAFAVVPGVGEGVGTFFAEYPLLAPAVGMLLSLAFRRGRGVVTLLVLAVAAVTIGWLDRPAAGPGALDEYVWNALTLLLPLNFAIVAGQRERPVVTVPGAVGIVAVVVQPAIVALLWLAYVPSAIAAFGHQFVDLPTLRALALPQPAVLAFAAAGVAVVVRVIRSPGPFEAALVWAVIGCFFALALGRVEPRTTLLLAAATLTVVAGVTEASAATAYRDGLTGLPARRALDEALEGLRGRYVIAMVDVDHFKRVNDTHGHDVGDQMLRMVASRLRAVGGGGRAYRFGGEEFAVLFAGRSAAWALPHLEKLREGIAAAEFRLREVGRPKRRPKQARTARSQPQRLSLTVSVGVAESRLPHDSPERVIRAADVALYRAKQEGRNRVAS
jgi:diguanylate cyclase (GGDEF)-like protein